GAMMEPVPPRVVLAIDVRGGKVRAKVAPNPGQPTNRGGGVDDDAATEGLFLNRDGTLEGKSSARDNADADRKGREETFKKWTDDTSSRSPSGPTPKKEEF